MSINYYNEIKNNEREIEKQRLEIKELKKEISLFRNKKDVVSNIYEYLAAPICAISILLTALISGIGVYILPISASVLAIGIVSYKFSLKNKIEKLKIKLDKAKEIRKKAYENREIAFENIFNRLHNKHMDNKDYYHQLLEIHEKCNVLNEYMEPYKNKRNKISKIKNTMSGIFDFILAPLGSVVIPLCCAFISMGPIAEIVMMAVLSATLLGFALTDNQLTSKIEELSDEIDSIKSDRTVNYIRRDLKLTEAVEYLKRIDSKYNDLNITTDLKKNKNTKQVIKTR